MKPVAVKVSDAGRLTLPAEVRRALGLQGAGHVVMRLEGGEVRLSTMRQELKHIRALARPYAPKDRLASDELIAERHSAARKE